MRTLLIIAALTLIEGCGNSAMRTPEPLVEGQTDREFIVLRTGQTCEIKGSKIIACERNTYRYAESKADVEAMTEKEEQ